MARLKTAILISGRGSNMQALIEAAAAPDYPADVVLVISNKEDAPGLAFAKEAGVPTLVIPHKNYESREAFDHALDNALRAANIELVCLAGFMRILTEGFIENWRDKMVNIHPSLLPLFKGLHSHRQALEAGAKLHGCTVHFVRPGVDEGPIIAQATVPVLPDDTEETLAARVLAEEHRLYPQVLGWIAENKVNVMDEKVFVTGNSISG